MLGAFDVSLLFDGIYGIGRIRVSGCLGMRLGWPERLLDSSWGRRRPVNPVSPVNLVASFQRSVDY